MAKKDRIEQDDIIDLGILKTLDQLNDKFSTLTKSLSDAAKAATDLHKSSNPENLQQLADATQKYNKINQESQQTTKQLTDVQTKYQQKLSQVTKEEERLRIAVQKKKAGIKDSIKWQNAATGSINKLNAANKILRERIRGVSTETAIGRKRILAYNKAIDRNSAKVEKASDAATRQAKGIGRYGNALKGVAGSLGLVTGGAALAAMAIRKIVSAVKDAVKVNREWEKSFTNVLTLLDEVQKKEFGVQLEKGALDVMAKYGFAIEDTNKALFEYISATGDAAGANEFLDKAGKLAIAGNAELSSVVDGATNVMNAYKDAAGNTEDVLNAFFATQVKGKTDVGLLATSIGKVASTAAAAGIPLNELFGTFAGLTKFIGSTEESATTLAATMNAIINPSTEAAATFERLHIETGIVAIQNNGLLKTLTQVADAYEENGDVLAELIPNIRALKGVAGLSSEAIAEIEANILDLNDSEKASMLVQEAFNEQVETGARSAEVMKGSYRRMLISIGGGESIFKKIGNSFRKNLTEHFTETSKNVELFRVTWNSEMKSIELSWQKLTRQITRDEFQKAIKENEEETAKSLLSITERYDGVTKAAKEATEAEIAAGEAAAEAAKKAAEEAAAAKIASDKAEEKRLASLVTLENLRKKVSELQKDKNSLLVTDLRGIEIKNIEIKAIQDQITELNNLGIKQEEIIDIKEKASEDILELMEEQNEKELEILDEKLDEENELTLEKLEEFQESKREIKDKENADDIAAIEAKKARVREYTNFAIGAAQTLSNSIFAFQNQELANAQTMDIEKAKARGASEEEMAAIEKKYAKKRQEQAIKQAYIDMALGAISALANSGNPILGIIMAAIVVAAGLINIASIKSQKFAKGTPDSGSQGQIATVGEKGKERIKYADGTSAMTPNKATLTYLPPHSEVIPNHNLQSDLAEMQAAGMIHRSQREEIRNRQETDRIVKAIKNKKELTLNITENGIGVTAKKGSNWYKYISNHYRG